MAKRKKDEEEIEVLKRRDGQNLMNGNFQIPFLIMTRDWEEDQP